MISSVLGWSRYYASKSILKAAASPALPAPTDSKESQLFQKLESPNWLLPRPDYPQVPKSRRQLQPTAGSGAAHMWPNTSATRVSCVASCLLCLPSYSYQVLLRSACASALLQLDAGSTPHVAQPTLLSVGFPPLVAALPPTLPPPSPPPAIRPVDGARHRVTVGQNIESEPEQ